MKPWLQLSLDMMRLTLEVQSVIGLRLFRMATGGVPAVPEATHITFADIQRILVRSAASGQPQDRSSISDRGDSYHEFLARPDRAPDPAPP